MYRRFESFTFRNNIHPLPKRLREQSAKLLFVGSNPTRVSKGVVVQLAEHLLCKQGVVSSSLTFSTKIRGYLDLIADGKQEIVQVVIPRNGKTNKCKGCQYDFPRSNAGSSINASLVTCDGT